MSARILSIEDDHFISEMYTQALVDAGYEVDNCATGATATEMIQNGSYDLILLDIFLPEKTGIEIVNELRDKQLLGSSKIIIMTNYMQDDTSRSQLEALVDGYLIKANVVPSKLVEYVGQILGQTGG